MRESSVTRLAESLNLIFGLRRLRACGALAVLALLSAPDVALTQSGSADRTASSEASSRAPLAGQLYQQGLGALKEERFKDAVSALDASYRLQQEPIKLYALALAYYGLGYPDKAIEAFSAYVEFADPETDGHIIAAVQQEMDRITAGVARFMVSLRPPDATITIDGQAVLPRDGQLWLKPGRHQIAIQAPQHEPYEQGLEARPGRFELDIQLRPLKVSPAARAEQLLAHGDALTASGDLFGALQKYDSALALMPSARGAGSAALAREQLGDLGPAEAQLRQALARPNDPWVQEHLRELSAAKTRLEQQLGTVVIIGAPELTGAGLWVNGRPVGRLPLPDGGSLRAEAGVLTVKATLAGYKDFVKELELVPHGREQVTVTMKKSPVLPVGLPLPWEWPGPDTASSRPSVAAAAAAGPSPSDEVAEPVPALDADVGTAIMRSDDTHRPEATGVEMAVNVGYEAALSNGPAGSSGGLGGRLFSIGYRPIWPVSFGVQVLNTSLDPARDGTQFILSLHPGFYVRGHLQQVKRAQDFDVWAGIGLQPLAMSFTVYDNNGQGPAAVDLSKLDQEEAEEVVITSVVKGEADVGDLVTLQSVNLPLELGVAFYLRPNLALEFASALTFWIPTEQCFFIDASGDRVCYDAGLKSQTSLYLGLGLSFLP